MKNVIDARVVQVSELRRLARQFREKATETQLSSYVELMHRSAADLDKLADQIESEIDDITIGAPAA